MGKEISRSNSLGAKTMFAAMQALKDNGGSLSFARVAEEVMKRVTFDTWELATYEASGAVRWKTVMGFWSSGYVKAGYILKKRGLWYLTPEGEEAMKLGANGILEKVRIAYKEWQLSHPQSTESGEADDSENVEGGSSIYQIEQIEQTAIDSIKNFIAKKNAY